LTSYIVDWTVNLQSKLSEVTNQSTKVYPIKTTSVSFKTAPVNGLNVFYREAGDPQAPAVLLLHGFPTSSPAGAEAFRRDNPSAKVVFYDTGHFALETHAAEIGAEIRAFLSSIR
jgi:pimeloyl-ACP methyl ester carboxylesterase